MASYNAPEVARQKDQPISIDQLHKCDIWAFGLCAWEVLANGQVYKYSLPLSTSAKPPTYSEAQGAPRKEPSIENEDFEGSETLHASDIKELAIEFVNNLDIGGIGFERGFLRPLMNQTLELDPKKRISDLSRLPIILSWNKAPGGHSLQSKLALFAMLGIPTA